jgi:probable HAF family extracellular repeat protein
MTTYTFSPIDDGTNGTGEPDLNDAGQIVGYYVDSSGVDHGFLYNGVTYTPLNAPSGTKGTQALGINDAGQIVGAYADSSGAVHGFLYNSSAFTYTTLNDPLGTKGTEAVGINDAGQIVGTYVDSSGLQHGFLDTGGTYTTLNDPVSGAYDTVATGVNDAGQIVGAYTDSSGTNHGFLYSAGIYFTIDDPLGIKGTAAFAINNLGQIAGNYYDRSGAQHGFLYTGSTYITLDDPLGTNGTYATAINDLGQIVGTYVDSNRVYHGFEYVNGIYTTRDDPLDDGTQALGINNAGQIVGTYTDSSGAAHGFLANPSSSTAPPPPTSVQQEVLGLYAALYNRAADFPGYSFWVGMDGQQSDSGGVTVANAGTTAVTLNDAQVLGQGFVNTQATFFNQTYASLTDTQFINALYVNIGGNAGDPGGVAYWQGLLAQAEGSNPTAAQIQAARAGLVGQFVHDLIDYDLTPGAAALNLTAAQYQQAQTRQTAINDKIAVSLAYSNISQQTGGTILDAHSVGDAAYNEAVAVIQNVASDPTAVTAAILGINTAVAAQNLLLI